MTPQVVLEPLCAAHARALYPLLADPELWRFTDSEAPSSCEVLAARYTRLESHRSPDGSQIWLNYAIAGEEDGIVGFVQATIENGRAEIAYVVGARFQHRGYATSAVRKLLAELRDYYAVVTFIASVDERNSASLRLLTHLGFIAVDASGTSVLRLERAASDA